MSSATRILIAELDSPAQAARFARSGTRDAIAELTGMLRIGMLVSSNVLVTDAMLLDGAYFIALGPSGVLGELGAPKARYPLTITGVHDTLREGLQARLNNPEFRWSLPGLSDGEGAPDSVKSSWERWLHFAENGIVRYERQRAGDAPMRISAPPVKSEAELLLLTGADLSQIQHRSAAWAAIDALPLDDDGRDRVRQWWNDAYLRMIAENASADWVSFDSDRRLALTTRASDFEVPLSTALLDWARESTPATIAVAWDASHAQRRRLREKPTWSRMRDLAFTATQVASGASRRTVLVASTAKLMVATVVLALAFPGLELGSIDSPWTWVAFASAVATTVPFDSLNALRVLLERDPRARLVVHRGRSA